jgi:lipopolysaccharide/colanic/teichoic acid biosynthesis glycosyltransferase
MSAATPHASFYDVSKRILDLAFSSLALVICSPLMAVMVLVLLVCGGRPIFFIQVRPGLGGRPFRLVKFRTMRSLPDKELLDESNRVTRIGKFLRSTSLDELPSLWNVMRGDLSFVGPRPLLMEYLPLYLPGHLKRHDVRPGMTGLSQVSGRNLVSWKQRLDMDIEYVQNRRFALDLEILLRTFLVVLGRRGVSRADGTIMPRLDSHYDEQPDS